MGGLGRPINPGGELFFLPPGYMEDTRTFALFKAQGYAGIVIHLWLMEQIKNNYFWEFDPDAAASYAQRILGQPNPAQVANVIRTLCRVGFYDETLFDRYGILTSVWHQLRHVAYVCGKKAREKKHVIYLELWLLEADDFVPATKLDTFMDRAVFRALKNNLTGVNLDYTGVKLDKTAPNGMEWDGMGGEPPNPHREPCGKPCGKPGPEKKSDQASHVLRLLRKRTGTDYVGDNAARILVYRLLERGYTKRDLLAVTNKVCDRAEADKSIQATPAAIYNPVSFDVHIIDDRMDVLLKHPDQERDHYKPLANNHR